MTREREHYEAALEIAEQARKRWLEDPTDVAFRAWRDASDIAIKWNRAVRLDGGGYGDYGDDELERLLGSD